MSKTDEPTRMPDNPGPIPIGHPLHPDTPRAPEPAAEQAPEPVTTPRKRADKE